MDKYEQTRALFDQLPTVEVIACPLCEARGSVEGALNILCPRCKGSGTTTDSGTPLEGWDTHDRR